MIIQQLFSKDIDRNINGVVKVSQDDQASIEQELSEYVVTRELQKHFTTFFDNYAAAIDEPTDRVGVWISGFFGSGKSHFLKMLGYLLANRPVGGKSPYGYFEGKIADPMVASNMKRACEVPTETILFNIDDKAGQWKEGPTAKTAILRAFARVFYEHRGFYGANLNVGRLEEHIEGLGKTAEFRAAFERINGGTWEETRKNLDFFQDDLADALQEVLGWSEAQARSQAEYLQEDFAMAPEDLVSEIAAYADARAAENGGRFRLLFLVDEVGQFIGSDVNLMLSLQTIVEDLGARCRGRVWVMVTSQEAIDEVTKVAGNDFSKIQGRFNTRLSLSSSSVDEVIKRRVLDKTPEAAALLDAQYEQQSAVLKNIFTFEDSRSDLVGYRSVEDFREAYPFVEYQFNLMRDVLKQVRIHGNSGKHLSGGERSMLSGFQESAQAVKGQPTTALVPLWRFYDTLAEFLEHDIRQVIDRCQRAAEDAAGIQPQDVAVLKTLYLIRYINDIKPTVGNLAVLMTDSISIDKVQLKKSLADSLARLVRENYVSRSGDTYQFLTDEEQDITREIKSMQVEPANIIEEVKKSIFGRLYTAQKVRVGVNDFKFDAYVDDSPWGNPSGGMRLDIVTVANPLSKQAPEEIGFSSSGKAVVVLSSEEDYYEVLENAAKIDKWMKTRTRENLPEGTQRIYEAKRKEANGAKEVARQMIERDLKAATVGIDGTLAPIAASGAKDLLDQTLQLLAKSVYRSAGHITDPLADDKQLRQILLNSNVQESLAGTGGGNEKAIAAVRSHLQASAYGHGTTSVADLHRAFGNPPYGWRELDIAGCIASLAAAQEIEFVRAGAVVPNDDPKLPLYLTRRSEVEKTEVRLRQKVDEMQLKRVRQTLQDMELDGTVPADEDSLFAFAADQLQKLHDWCKEVFATAYTQREYPGRDTVVNGATLLGEVLAAKADRHALFAAIDQHEDDLCDLGEDLEAVRAFFPNQQRIFDEALKVKELMAGQQERDALKADTAAAQALSDMNAILANPNPWRDIPKLNGYISQVQDAHARALSARRADLLDKLEGVRKKTQDYAEGKKAVEAVLSNLETTLARRRDALNAATTMQALDSQELQLNNLADEQYVAIDEAHDAATRPVTPPAHVPPASHVDNGGNAVPVMPPKPKSPQVKELDRQDLCPARRLTSEQEVEAYVDNIRQQLLQALKETGAVRMK